MEDILFESFVLQQSVSLQQTGGGLTTTNNFSVNKLARKCRLKLQYVTF